MGGVTGSNDPTVANWGNIGFQGAHISGGADARRFEGFQDGTSSLNGVWGNTPYLQDIGSPKLQQVILGLSDQPNGTHGETQYTPTHAYYDSFSENLEQLIDKYGLSEEQINQLVMAHLTDTPADDNFINSVLNELDSAVAGDLAQLFELPSTADQASNLRERAGNHSSALKGQISDLQAYADSLPEGSEKQAIQEKINELTQNLDSFNEHLASLPENPSREQLAKLATELGMSGENLRSIAGELSELAGDSPELKSLLANFQHSVNSSTTTLDGLLQELYVSWEISTGDFSSLTNSFKETFANKLTQEFDKAFEAELTKFTDDPELQAQLRFVHYNPDAEIPENIKSMTQTVEQNAINQMNAEGWNIPQSYTPPSNGLSYNMRMQNSADEMFEGMLQNWDPPLTPDQQKALRNMYYGVEKPAGDLAAVLQQIESGVAAELAAAFGLPDGFPVPKGSFSHQGNINGQFQMKFLELLNALPADQKAAVLQAINDPMNPAISAETKALLNKLFNQAAGSIRAQFGLPEGWTPSASVLREIGTMSPENQSIATQISEMETEVALAISYVEQWPNSPTKAVLLNVLKIVSEAIATLKAQLAIIMQKDAELATKLGQAQLDTALLKVHENLKKLEEIKNKQAKMKALGPLFKIFKVISFIFTAVLCLAAGPVGWAILGVLIADMAINGLDSDKSLIGKAFEAVSEAITGLLESWGFPPELAQMCALVVNLMICVAISMAGSPMLGMQIFFEHSGIIQSFFTDVCGCDPMVGEIIAMVTQMVVEIVVMILLTIVTGGAGATLLVASVVGRVAMMVGKVVQKIVTIIMRVAQLVMKIAQAAQKFARLSQTLMKISMELMNFALKVNKIATKIIQWAQKTLRLTKQVTQSMGKVKWTKSLKNAFSKTSKTGVQQFDDAVNALRKQLDVAKWLFRGIGVTFGVLQTTVVVAQFRNSLLAAEIARIRGDMEAMMTELEAFIQVLKKMVAKILEALSGIGEWIGQIGQQQGSMWKEASETMDAVAASNQAS
ncbi:hypothetical protein [Waddlia chondrophila]|uniref:Putative membrane protein n=1 Tax=Waddlia chondrophila (strain ATCC VR-1470 / WSU 86-1044) TaxID=716544 RepID=D6YSA5_WADCW|nr:hypothetical protein [Waddlia chondrophila]ADI38950.1 putative membrane protein [Waddlia chondrophila WSU 86-1044]